MFLWFVLAFGLLVTGLFLLQSLLMCLCPRKAGPPSSSRSRARRLAPEFIALEAQFFLAPTRAIAEARDLLRGLGAPVETLKSVIDPPSFSRALLDAQAYLSTRNTLAEAPGVIRR